MRNRPRFGILAALAVLAVPGMAMAVNCSTPAPPMRAGSIAPLASELAFGTNAPIGSPDGVLSQAYSEAQSVDQVLLRIRVESCSNMAMLTPAPSVVSPDNPATYKPRTQYDNTPWRFNMTQNGKNMTADEFSAWMKSRGVRVARGRTPVEVPATTPATAPGIPSGVAPGTLAPTANDPVPAVTMPPVVPVVPPATPR
jgi:hypothetical protein